MVKKFQFKLISFLETKSLIIIEKFILDYYLYLNVKDVLVMEYYLLNLLNCYLN